MNLKEFTLAHQKFCVNRVATKKCGGKRDLKSDRCAHCVVNYLNAQAALETYDGKAAVSNVAPKFGAVSDDALRKGLMRLALAIRSGKARTILPVSARPVIGSYVFEVVDHDTVKVEGYEHTMTLRLIQTDYHEMPFDGANGSTEWATSKVRQWLNNDLFNKLPVPLQEVIIAPKLITVLPKSQLDGANAELGSERTGEVTMDKVWIPSVYQMGFTSSPNANEMEGDVLDAFDDDLTIDYIARRQVAEYHGDEIVPKRYWLRTSVRPEVKEGDVSKDHVAVVSHMGKEISAEPYEVTAMVVPFITLG